MIPSAGIGLIINFHSNINASVYKELLHQYTLPNLRKETVETPIFMQDHAPCHKAKTVLSFLEEEGIDVMRWPPQGPDRNLFENVWKIIRYKAQNRNPQNIDQLIVFMKEKWESVSTPTCKELISLCGQRYNEVI